MILQILDCHLSSLLRMILLGEINYWSRRFIHAEVWERQKII